MNTCTVVSTLSPLSGEHLQTEMPAGQTLTEMFGDGASHSLVASIGGHVVPRERWKHVRPRAGQTVHAVNYPQGGNGGKALRLVAMVVVAYLSYGTSLYVQGTSYAAYAGVAGLAVSVIGPMHGQALVANGGVA